MSVRTRFVGVGRGVVGAACLAACAGAAVGGLGDPGGSVFTWTGAMSDAWNIGSNWNQMSVPQDGDSAHILDADANIVLTSDSANLGSLFHSAQRSLSTNGHRLRVTAGSGETTLVGVDSRLHVAAAAGTAFETDVLELTDEARLQMAGGTARVLDQLTAASGARLTGHGLVRVESDNAAALNLFDAGPMNIASGDLELEVIGAGSIALPELVQLLDPGRSLVVNGPLFLPADDVIIGPGCTVEFADPWTIGGVLTGQAGIGATASVVGAPLHIDGSITAAPGTLRFEAPVSMDGSTVTTVQFNGRLRIDGPSLWQGELLSSGGVIEPNDPSGFWDVTADITLGSFALVRTRIDGSATTLANGGVIAPGLGGIADSAFELMPTGWMELAQPQSQFIVNNTAVFHVGSEVFGDGKLNIGATGAVFFGPSADIEVDVDNAGDLNAGLVAGSAGYTYIDGDFTQKPSGSLVVEIGGADPDLRDVYEVSGAAAVAGVVEVSLLDGFEPQVGESFATLFVHGGPIAGAIAVAGEPGFEATIDGGTFTLTYIGVPEFCAADLSGDSAVNSADLNILLASFGGGPDGDIDGDGDTDSADLNLLLADFGSICWVTTD